MRVCFFGDSFTQGTGDDTCLGWVGRVSADARQSGVDLTAYNLGVRKDTSTQIRHRWRGEAEIRLIGDGGLGLVFAFGNNDEAQIESEEELFATIAANADDILRSASGIGKTLLIGPVPVEDVERAVRIDVIYERLSSVAMALNVPFLDLRSVPEEVWEVWRAEAKAGDGVHPNAGGYSALASYISRWSAWQSLTIE